jgi:hypothetical protein
MQADGATADVMTVEPVGDKFAGVPSFEAYARVHYIRAAPEVWERALAELG